jgi:hypothetical protein
MQLENLNYIKAKQLPWPLKCKSSDVFYISGNEKEPFVLVLQKIE